MMKSENKILIYSMINNLIISLIKIITGFILKLNSLLADGLQTFSDFVTDIVSMVASKVGTKKPTKYHPFGFGRVEYLSNLFIGILLFALSIFIVIHSLSGDGKIPPVWLLFLTAFLFILKLVAIIIMERAVKKINSQILITSIEESKTDLYATIGVFIIIVLMQFSESVPILKYSDMIGTIIVALIIMKTALKIILQNAQSIIGETTDNKELQEKVKELIYEFDGVKDDKQEFMKYGSYYKLHLTLELDENLTLKKIVRLEKRIKNTIVRHRSLKIKYVSIYITNKI